MKITVGEASDSVEIDIDGERVAYWNHHDTHEELFEKLCEKLGVEYEYQEIY